MAIESVETISHHSNVEVNQHQISSSQGQSTECTIPIEDLLHLMRKRPLDLSIFRVPYKFREVNEAAYSPLIVSIGPYHANTGTRSFLWPKLAKKHDDRQAAKVNMTSLPQQKLAKKRDPLLDMEENKLWYMRFFLDKTIDKDQVKTLKKLREEIKGEERCVHLSYAEYINFGSNELMEMMMVDGCFILELFIRSWFKDIPYEAAFKSWCEDNVHKDDPNSQRDPYDGDPIFHNSWMLPTLRQDLALLENQIPFFILQHLFDFFMDNRKRPPQIPPNTSHPKFEIPLDKKHQKFEIPSVPLLALSFFRPDLKLNQLKQEDWEAKDESITINHIIDKKPTSPNKNDRELDIKHLLDFLHKFYLPTTCKTVPAHPPADPAHAPADQVPAATKSKETKEFREGATKLVEAGIEFVKGVDSKAVEDRPKGCVLISKRKEKKNSDPENFLEVVFDDKKGDINIPQLRIDETMESLLRNLIAYEQCSPKRKQYVSSYVILMKSLLRSSTDAELLEEKGIIEYNLGGKGDVLNFFENISMGVVPEYFCFGKMCKEVNIYKESWLHCHRIIACCKVRHFRYCKALKRDHCSNPWKIIAFITAFILLGLTGLQTGYAVYSYHVPPH